MSKDAKELWAAEAVSCDLSALYRVGRDGYAFRQW